jgi:uncharacterized protein (TIGR02271 family)
VSERAEHGGGDSRPRPDSDETTVVRYEEEPAVGKRSEIAAHARVRRLVEQAAVRAEFPRQRETLAQERVPVDENDGGKIEVLPDGSVSIPLFEEELVVTKRTVLRERMIIRKESVTDWETVEAELRREHVSFDSDEPKEPSSQKTPR